MSKIKLGDVTKIRTGKLDANASSENGKYPFFTCSKDPLRIDSYSYDCECVLVAGNGDLNVKYYKGKFDAYQRTYIIEDNSSGRLYMPYLYYYLDLYVEELRKQSIGGVIKYIKLGNLTDAIIDLPSIEAQKETIKILDKSRKIIENKNMQLQEYDQLIKSRFVEMFGDPQDNLLNFPEYKIGDTCFVTKLAGYEYTKYITYQETGEVVMVKAQNVKNGALNKKDLSYISLDVSDKLPRSQLKSNDLVMTYVGANIGDLAIIDDENKYHLAPNVALIRPYSMLNPVFFMYLLMFKRKYILGNSADTAKGAIGMEKIRKLNIFVPKIEDQNQFAKIVKQIDKLKFVVQKSLDETQKLFDSLMQEYFG